MKIQPTLPALIERFFTERLMRQRNVSPHTIASYRDTFRLLFAFAREQLGKSPSSLDLRDIDAPLISRFLDHLETSRSAGVRTRNLRLTAIRSFFDGSSWVSGCWRQSRGVRPSDPYPIADYVFPSRLLVGAMADIVH
jgi:site-specific recombinase XerD